jgi:Uma2 family endonuclease
MTVQALKPVTADEFLEWATDRRGPRYELFRGRPVQMAPERAAHADAKLNLAIALRMAARGTDAHVYPDGMSVVVDEGNVFEPDTLVRLGGPLPGDAVKVTDPIIVGEVLSPSTSRIDVTAKLVGYFTIPSLQHYLVVDAKARTMSHYRRDVAGQVIGDVISEGLLTLDPPRLSFDVGQVFEGLPA